MENKALYIISSISIIPLDEIDFDDDLVNLGIDSIKKVEMIIALENEFNIEFDESELDPSKLKKVSNVLKLVSDYLVRPEK